MTDRPDFSDRPTHTTSADVPPRFEYDALTLWSLRERLMRATCAGVESWPEYRELVRRQK